ncbi:hypothetical protein D3C71_2202960 [compost metagenome]
MAESYRKCRPKKPPSRGECRVMRAGSRPVRLAMSSRNMSGAWLGSHTSSEPSGLKRARAEGGSSWAWLRYWLW